jgi:hypothetical protein
MMQIQTCVTSKIKVFPQIKKRGLFPFSCSYLNASLTNVQCELVVYIWTVIRIQIGVSDLLWRWERGEQIKLYVWWLVNSKDKACLFASCGKGHFIPSESIVARRKAVRCRVYCWNCNVEHLPKMYLVFKICGRNITLTEWVHRCSIQILHTQNSYSFHMKVRLRMSAFLRAYIWKQ